MKNKEVTPVTDKLQPLFDLMSNSHEVILLHDEMSEILNVCREIDGREPTTLLSEGKETVEEWAENYAIDKWKDKNDYALDLCKEDVIAGAQWQSQHTAKEIEALQARVKEMQSVIDTLANFVRLNTDFETMPHEIMQLILLHSDNI